MRETKPTVSIIMASYNHAAYIGAAVESVQGQDYDAWELLIADDASTDRTLEVLAAYTGETRIKVFPFRVNREYHMRNYAAEQAQGDYLAFLNSDDVFRPGKLKKQVEVFESNPQLAAVFTHVRCIDENGRGLPGHDLEKIFATGHQSRQQWLRRFFLSGNCLCISSAMVRRAAFNEIGGFNPLLIQVSDLDLWIRVCLKWDIHVIPEPLTEMRILTGKRNLSAGGPASKSRALVESQQAYAHYFCGAGLEQMLDIFPELAARLPEDTPAWRCYVLCRMATTLSGKSLRLLAFVKLHELLKDHEVRKALLGRNRRLLQALFFSEGAAALDKDYPGMVWTVRFPPPGPSDPAEGYTFWTTATDRGVVCLSVPNPGIACRLALKIEARSVSVRCRQLRLYDPQTGNLIFDTRDAPAFELKTARNKTITRVAQFGRGLARQNSASNAHLPEIDFAVFSAKEIDLEAEIEVAEIRNRFRALGREAKRRLLRMGRIRR